MVVLSCRFFASLMDLENYLAGRCFADCATTITSGGSSCRKAGCLRSLATYDTPRYVKVVKCAINIVCSAALIAAQVENIYLGVLLRTGQIAILLYIVFYAMWFKRGYQEQLTSSYQ